VSRKQIREGVVGVPVAVCVVETALAGGEKPTASRDEALDAGDLHPADRSRTSFNSQITSVFRHPKKRDLYIALADRWMGPQSGLEFESGETSRLVQSSFAKIFATPRQPLTPAEQALVPTALNLKIDTSISRYVWLPIRFDGDRPIIDWRSEWSLDEFYA
jgi:hypothetical protein